ncbi:addiction module antidote protein [Vineibacter terrae]|uniref:addiction module antidote protein n=1 Tax=Vineibacter terrae TaxID=2586908 RepID=UPI002E3484C8|nr:addiction module antidote protein [Vineibacter terrae]HEX2888746.1 addiction module antidote protein [Vineibacter terrae]
MAETRPFDAAEYLDTDEAIEAYLDEAFQDGDPALIRHALRTAARAKGMTALARDVGMTREGLYKALGDAGNPSFDAVAKLVQAMGMRLQVKVAKSSPRRARKKVA